MTLLLLSFWCKKTVLSFSRTQGDREGGCLGAAGDGRARRGTEVLGTGSGRPLGKLRQRWEVWGLRGVAPFFWLAQPELRAICSDKNLPDHLCALKCEWGTFFFLTMSSKKQRIHEPRPCNPCLWLERGVLAADPRLLPGPQWGKRGWGATSWARRSELLPLVPGLSGCLGNAPLPEEACSLLKVSGGCAVRSLPKPT